MKNLLLLQVSNDICTEELITIGGQAEMYGINALKNHHVVKNQIELGKVLSESKIKYDYIYLCGHANQDGFGAESGDFFVPWSEFGRLICETECLNHSAILMLACCRTGYNQVAFKLFRSCNKIDYVFGPSWTLEKEPLVAGTHIFLYNLTYKKSQPNKAAEKASIATDYDFFCYDRIEIENSISYLQYLNTEKEEDKDVYEDEAFYKKYNLENMATLHQELLEESPIECCSVTPSI